MSRYLAIFSNRELAVGLWLVPILVWFLTKPPIRDSINKVFRAFFRAKIVVPLAALAVYVGLVILFLRPLGLWTMDNLKDTIYWFTGVGFASFFRLARDTREDSLFRSILRDTITIAVVIEFIANLESFPLLVEFVAVPLVVFITAINAIAERRSDGLPVTRLAGCVLASYGLSALLYSIISGIRHPEVVLSSETLVSFVLPPILTIAYIPFAYTLLLAILYESIFTRLGFATRDKRLYHAAKRRILFHFNVNLFALQSWSNRPRNLTVKDDLAIDQLLSPETGPQPRGSAEIVDVRLVPWTNPDGREMQMVLVDWKNTGSTPIRAVNADITPYDDTGTNIHNGASNYPIFAVFDSQPGIAPGETYREPNDSGFVLVTAPGLWLPAKTVKVTITEVRELSGM